MNEGPFVRRFLSFIHRKSVKTGYRIYNLDCKDEMKKKKEKKNLKSPQSQAVPQKYLRCDCLTASIERGDS